MNRDQLSELLADLRRHEIVRCLSEEVRRSRIYWLTEVGLLCQRRLYEEAGMDWTPPVLLAIDWTLVAWVCYSHRTAVLKALSRPMQPCEIKRRARMLDEGVRMSANNVRDVIRLFLAKGIVVPVRDKKRRHLLYDLTTKGVLLRFLLMS